MTDKQAAAPLKRRFLALVYESLLVGAVSCAAALPAGLLALSAQSRPVLAMFWVSLVFFAAWGWYFLANWRRRGTLAMCVWHIGLADKGGGRPCGRRLAFRFLWAVLLVVLLPLLAYGLLRYGIHMPPHMAGWRALCCWLLPWGYALLDRDGQFLYDKLAGTRLVDLKAV
ncbi:MAG: RDD family protein [Neisseria sp.]|nr:RDD family protein [Neisseria sp.]